MTSFHKFFGKAIAISAALSMTAGLALAADGTVSADKIIGALKPKPLTRGLSTGPQVDPAVKAKEIAFVAKPCATATPGRSRSASAKRSPRSRRPSRTSIWKFSSTSTRPRSARVRRRPCRSSARRSRIRTCRGSTFVVAGHTDGIGGDGLQPGSFRAPRRHHQALSGRQYGIAGSDLVTVGYGKTKLKDTANPADPINRRVQVVNMDTKTASK